MLTSINNQISVEHLRYIQRCFFIANAAAGRTMSNPKVGAILVSNTQIISEGIHQAYGLPHAEVNCISSCPPDLQHMISNATLYISLEPCCHFGKTPPCTDLIIKHRIKRVVIGSTDIDPKVAGKGIQLLLNQGIEVINLNLIDAQIALNFPFWHLKLLKRPIFTAKFSQSADQKLGLFGQRTKISSKAIDTFFHRMRSSYDAIIVGYHTALIDRPILNNRHTSAYRQPVRLLIDPQAALSLDQIAPSNSHTFIINQIGKNQQIDNFKWIAISDISDPQQWISLLDSLNLHNILIEGGARTIDLFAQMDLLDACYIATHPKHKLGSAAVSAPQSIHFHKFRSHSRHSFGEMILDFYIR